MMGTVLRVSISTVHKLLKQSSQLSLLCRVLSTENTPVALQSKKQRSSNNNDLKHFSDFRRVRVIGGNGGNGAVHFLRLFVNDRAGPCGGDGGNGGHVIFHATNKITGLQHLTSQIIAKHGSDGRYSNMHGKCGSHTYVDVPLGTIFRNEKNEMIAELTVENSLFVAARGGAGGRGNPYFTTDTNQAPEIAEFGGKGEELVYLVELRCIAHVGLIGFPNAGKSTLLRAVSRARPKVASYPFTTLRPHIGMILYSDYEQVAVADIPGLIKDAHKNRGLGIDFLRHVDRCRGLLYVLDLSQSDPSPTEQLETLRFELEQFKLGLSRRPAAIVANKMDLSESKEYLPSLKEAADIPVIPVSAKMGNNIPQLLAYIRKIYDGIS